MYTIYPNFHPEYFKQLLRKKKLVFITDNELTKEAWAERHPEQYIEFCKHADILIHDAQYTPEERKRRKGWGHSDYKSVIDLAVHSHAKRLVLFHHDPGRKDSELGTLKALCENLVRERDKDLIVDAAKEGSELML